jgi:8-oxo-dGTP diphosphatase
MTATELTRRDADDGIEQQVVGAIIEHHGRVLLLQRPTEDFRGGTWELPSGKVEPGEDLITALHREVTEETGLIVAAVTAYPGAFGYTSGSGKRTRQHSWSLSVTRTDPVRLTEHDAYAWVDPLDDTPVSAEVTAVLSKLP